jgi:hypothetical protein
MSEDLSHLSSYILGTEVFGNLSVKSEAILETRHIPRFNWVSTARILVTTNSLLALFPRPGDESFGRVQNYIANALCTPSVLTLLEKPEFNRRPLFFRQQILTALKKVLRSGARDGGLHPNEHRDDLKALGRVLINLNNFLAPPEASDAETLITQLVPLMELYNPPSFDRGIVRTIEYLRIFDKNWPDFENGMSLASYFKSATGLSISSLLQITGAIYAYYYLNEEDLGRYLTDLKELNLRRSRYFERFDDVDDVEAFFAIYSRSLDELRDEALRDKSDKTKDYYDFGLFRRYPILNLSEDVFTCLDFGFLTEKLSFGFYRTLFNALPDDPERPGTKIKRLADTLQREWGKTIEEYVTGFLGPIQGFHPNVRFSLGKGEPKEIDAVFVEGKNVALLEIKGKFLSASAKYGSDSSLINELDRKFGRVSKGEKGGAFQLLQDIKDLYLDVNKVSALSCPYDLASATKVYPVLIGDEHALGFDLIQYLLRGWFEELKQGVTGVPEIAPLVVLTIDTLERLEPYLLNKSVSFIEFVSFYESEVQKGLPAAYLESHRVLVRFLKQRGFFANGRWETNQRTAEIFSSFMESTKPRLTP